MAMAVSEELAEFVLDARYGDLEAVEEGLKAGLEVNGKGHGGSTALLMASANGHLEIVRASTAPIEGVRCREAGRQQVLEETYRGLSCIFQSFS